MAPEILAALKGGRSNHNVVPESPLSWTGVEDEPMHIDSDDEKVCVYLSFFIYCILNLSFFLLSYQSATYLYIFIESFYFIYRMINLMYFMYSMMAVMTLKMWMQWLTNLLRYVHHPSSLLSPLFFLLRSCYISANQTLHQQTGKLIG